MSLELWRLSSIAINSIPSLLLEKMELSLPLTRFLEAKDKAKIIWKSKPLDLGVLGESACPQASKPDPRNANMVERFKEEDALPETITLKFSNKNINKDKLSINNNKLKHKELDNNTRKNFVVVNN